MVEAIVPLNCSSDGPILNTVSSSEHRTLIYQNFFLKRAIRILEAKSYERKLKKLSVFGIEKRQSKRNAVGVLKG